MFTLEFVLLIAIVRDSLMLCCEPAACKVACESSVLCHFRAIRGLSNYMFYEAQRMAKVRLDLQFLCRQSYMHAECGNMQCSLARYLEVLFGT